MVKSQSTAAHSGHRTDKLVREEKRREEKRREEKRGGESGGGMHLDGGLEEGEGARATSTRLARVRYLLKWNSFSSSVSCLVLKLILEALGTVGWSPVKMPLLPASTASRSEPTTLNPQYSGPGEPCPCALHRQGTRDEWGQAGAEKPSRVSHAGGGGLSKKVQLLERVEYRGYDLDLAVGESQPSSHLQPARTTQTKGSLCSPGNDLGGLNDDSVSSTVHCGPRACSLKGQARLHLLSPSCSKGVGDLYAPAAAQVPVEVKLFLQLQSLVSGLRPLAFTEELLETMVICGPDGRGISVLPRRLVFISSRSTEVVGTGHATHWAAVDTNH
ncbi:hypothetical protein EYF80_007359 [Liparis tanakae]|uniref:Uncharacterized protein n=1 Tax=Liparis tanakae TaxID=230148 RepID=A0A4Z2IYC4_9TELE|nr:hypothetical protein EYF80_007359 [Liparis tanakae]